MSGTSHEVLAAKNELRGGDGVSPLRIVEYLLLLVLLVGFGYMIYKFGFYWSFAAGIVIPLIIIALLFLKDRK